MSYDPNEVALLRQMIVKEQQAMKKRRGKGKVQDYDMEGSGIGAIVGAFARGFIPAVSRVASTVSRGVRSVIPRTTSTVSRVKPTTVARSSTASRTSSFPITKSSLASRALSYTPSLSTLGSVASVGLPVGFTAYQAIDYEKQKKIAEGQAEETRRKDDEMVAENQRIVDAEVALLKEEQRLAELERSGLDEENSERQRLFNAEMARIEEDRLKQIEMDKKYQEDMDKQYQEMLMYNQMIIEAQVRQAVEALRPSYQKPSKPAPPVIPPSDPNPVYPSEPSQGTTNPAVDPTAGMSAKQRAIYLAQQGKKGKGRHVDFQEGGNAWIEALKDWNNAELHRGEMWCLPKKGSKQINQVKKVMEKIKKGQKTPILAPQTKKTRSKKVKAVERGQTLLSFGEK